VYRNEEIEADVTEYSETTLNADILFPPNYSSNFSGFSNVT
jgi:hypothetical protein